MVNLNLLELFVRIADTGSIAAAAREMDIAPSIASRQLASLERSFKTKLLTRTTRQLNLTEAGATLLEWARRVTTEYEQVSDELGTMQERPSGLIKLVSNDYASVTYLPAMLSKFCKKYPDVRIQLRTATVSTELVEGTCDLALYAGRMPNLSLVGRRVKEYKRRLCAAPTYIATKGKPKTAADLADHNCLTHSSSERTVWSFKIKNDVVSQEIQPCIEADNYLVLSQLVQQGLGIGRLAESLTNRLFASGELIELLPDHQCVYADGGLPAMWLVFADRKILRRTRLLADFLTAELERL